MFLTQNRSRSRIRSRSRSKSRNMRRSKSRNRSRSRSKRKRGWKAETGNPLEVSVRVNVTEKNKAFREDFFKYLK